MIASNTMAESGVLDWDGSGLGGGTHTLTLSVRDVAGNSASTSITITLNTPPPEPTVAMVIVPRVRVVTPFPPRPTAGSPLDPGLGQNKPAQFVFASEPPEAQAFTSIQPVQQVSQAQPTSAQASASPVLWGGAAAGLIGAAMVVAMEAQRKRKEEEARQIAEMHRLNAEMRAKEKQEALLIAQRREMAEYEALLAAMAAGQVAQAKLEDEEEAWLKKKATVNEQKEKTELREEKRKSAFKLAMPSAQYLASASSALIATLLPGANSKSNKLDVSKGEAGLEASGARSAAASSISKYSGSITNPQRPPGVSAVKWALLSREDRLEIAADHEARMLRVNPPWLLDSGRPVSIDKEDWKYYDAEDKRKAVADVKKMWNTWLDNGYKGDFVVYAKGGTGVITMTGVNIRSTPELTGAVENKVATLTRDTILMWTGQITEGSLNGKPAIWLEVRHGDKIAWVYAGLVADYKTTTSQRVLLQKKVMIDANLHLNSLGNSSKGQFIYLTSDGHVPQGMPDRIVKENLCWLFSAAYILGLPVDQVINKIVQESVFLTNKLKNDGLEGNEVINAILDLYDIKHQKFSEALNDPNVPIKWSMEDPAKLKMELDKGKALTALVKANGTTGVLGENENANHWVVVMDVFQEGGTWKVTLYNSIPNSTQTYDYQEYIDTYLSSAGWADYSQEPPQFITGIQ